MKSSDPVATRIEIERQSKQWAAKFPVTRFGYTALHEAIKTHDDHPVDIKFYRPSRIDTEREATTTLCNPWWRLDNRRSLCRGNVPLMAHHAKFRFIHQRKMPPRALIFFSDSLE